MGGVSRPCKDRPILSTFLLTLMSLSEMQDAL